jgi:membrane-bound lytic murein transglycosylase D
MRAAIRSSLLLLALTTLSACQQMVRPNLDTGGTEASEAFALAEETTQWSELETPDASTTTLPPGVSLGLGEDVFARINKGLSPNSCAAGSNSELWRRRYAGSPTVFARHVEHILPLLDFVSLEVERTGLPAEFVFIPLVESWYRPDAIGPGGPAGMWQMISSTARNHGIHIKSGYDGRLSPVESTRAALSYLKTLQGMFDDWQAIVMAYNAGEGRLIRAFRKSGNRTASAANRKPHGLSNITYDYVAKLQALACLVSEPEKHGLTLPSSIRFVPLSPILMDAQVKTLDQYAALNGKNAAELRWLNPGYKKGRIVDGVPRLLLTPIGVQQPPVEGAVAMIESTRSTADDNPAVQETSGANTEARQASTHRVLAGESLWSIAKLHRLTIDHLRRVNRLSRSAVVRPGQMLKLVP